MSQPKNPSFNLPYIAEYISKHKSIGTGTSFNNASHFDIAILLFSNYIVHLDEKQHWFELNFLKKFYTNLFNAEMAEDAIDFVKSNLSKDLDLVSLSRELNEITTEQARIQMLFYFFDLTVSDGHLHNAELEFVKNISILLEVSEQHYESILATYALYNPDLRKEFIDQLNPTVNDDLSLAYEILEVSPAISDSDLKSAYKKLVKEHHPDKIAHLGKVHVEKASDILKQINKAYEYICANRLKK